MKLKLKPTICAVLLFAGLINLDAQASKPPLDLNNIKVDLGVIDIFDLRINFNHNQSFKKFLADQEIILNGKPARIDLVEHASQADIGVKALFDSASLYVTLYQNGNVLRKDTIALSLLQVVKGFYPDFDVDLSDEGEVIVSNLKNTSQEYTQGMRNGFVITNINGSKINTGELERAEILLRQPKSTKLEVVLDNPVTGRSMICKVNIQSATKQSLNTPFSHKEIFAIFNKIRNSILSEQVRLKLQMAPTVEDKSIACITPAFDLNQCKTQDQIATHLSSLHPVSMSSKLIPKNGFSLTSIFKNEKFQIRSIKSSKYQPGDAALMVMQHYNYGQNRTHISKNPKIGAELRAAVRKLSGPFYNKPGVFANYCIAAFEYESNKNYKAALNQYYASLRKLDQIIASDRTKLEAKKFVATRIAHCSQQLGQNEYSTLMTFASNCISSAITQSSLIEKDKNFYDFTNQVKSICIEIEKQLAEQKKQRIMSIVSAVSNVAGGVAAFNIDATLSLSYLTNAIGILEDFDTYSRSINQLISQSTSAMEINLPAELQTEDVNPYEVKATEFIFESLVKENLDKNVLQLIQDYASNKPAIKSALDQFNTTYKITGKIDVNPLVEAFIRHEAVIYRYEKRGLKAPEKA